MNRQIQFKQYRVIDLIMFAAILCVTEYLVTTAATWWFPEQLYTVSVTASVVTIVLMRWGKEAVIHAVLGGFVFCIASHAAPEQYLFYCIGNVFAMGSLVFRGLIGSEKIRESAWLSVFFGMATLLFMQAGRFVVAVILGNAPRGCLGFFTTDTLSLLFTVVIIWIARRLDGVFEDQKHYILRFNEMEK